MLDFGFYNIDCMDGMKEFPDKFFDLAIVDPPYGINIGAMDYTKGMKITKNAKAKRRDYSGHAEWDKKAPDKEYFDELQRISKRQIIWGGNYFTEYLRPTKSWIVWDKRVLDNMRNDFADCELAWCSEDLGVARMFRYVWNGMLQGDMKNKEHRIHPTQKPVALYEWLLNNYAEKGYKILDTHVGSASSLIACHNLGFDYVGFELDADYYKAANKRLEAVKAQYTIFDYIERN